MLSPASLVKSIPWLTRNKLAMKTLRKTGPSINLYGTSEILSSHTLNEWFWFFVSNFFGNSWLIQGLICNNHMDSNQELKVRVKSRQILLISLWAKLQKRCCCQRCFSTKVFCKVLMFSGSRKRVHGNKWVLSKAFLRTKPFLKPQWNFQRNLSMLFG